MPFRWCWYYHNTIRLKPVSAMNASPPKTGLCAECRQRFTLKTKHSRKFCNNLCRSRYWNKVYQDEVASLRRFRDQKEKEPAL